MLLCLYSVVNSYCQSFNMVWLDDIVICAYVTLCFRPAPTRCQLQHQQCLRSTDCNTVPEAGGPAQLRVLQIHRPRRRRARSRAVPPTATVPVHRRGHAEQRRPLPQARGQPFVPAEHPGRQRRSSVSPDGLQRPRVVHDQSAAQHQNWPAAPAPLQPPQPTRQVLHALSVTDVLAGLSFVHGIRTLPAPGHRQAPRPQLSLSLGVGRQGPGHPGTESADAAEERGAQVGPQQAVVYRHQTVSAECGVGLQQRNGNHAGPCRA